jgi:hypothetical protein
MKPLKHQRPLLIAAALVLLCAGAGSVWLFQEIECLRIDSPDGRYRAIVTCRRLESLRPTFPGQSGDKAGFIRIEDKDGRNYGKVGLPMVSTARGLEWTRGGADLKLVCRWDFAKREYRFWNEAQTEEIVKQAR